MFAPHSVCLFPALPDTCENGPSSCCCCVCQAGIQEQVTLRKSKEFLSHAHPHTQAHPHTHTLKKGPVLCPWESRKDIFQWVLPSMNQMRYLGYNNDSQVFSLVSIKCINSKSGFWMMITIEEELSVTGCSTNMSSAFNDISNRSTKVPGVSECEYWEQFSKVR